MNAPFSYPNNVASSMFSGIAAQLMATNGLSPRAELARMKRAYTSLPVPLSPVMSTVASFSAILRARLITRLDSGSAATSSLGATRAASWRRAMSIKAFASNGLTM